MKVFKPRPWRKPLPRRLSVSETLDRIADQHGVWPETVLKCPSLLQGTGVKLEEVTPAAIDKAHAIHREKMRSIQARLRPKTESSSPPPTSPAAKPRSEIMGFPATSVVRWMGSEDWEFERAEKTLRRLKATLAETTVRTCLSQGRNGKGDIAALKLSQIKQLKEISNVE